LAADWSNDPNATSERRAVLERALGEVDAARPFDAVAHRVVHGGTRFTSPTLIDARVLADLDELSDLAPLHNPIALETIRAQRELLPELPAVAAFDTAFHATLPEAAFVYPLPFEWYSQWGVRRFGFHGLSVQWSVGRAARLLGRPKEQLSLVVAHLGSGCSVTAVHHGASVATSMGFTPLEGLAMGTRSGSVDPGVLLYALERRGLSTDELGAALEHDSGLAGISGIGADMRRLLAAAAVGNRRAQLAIDVFVRRAAEGIAAAASSLDRLDAVVFTGGIGENAAPVRAAICARLGVLGVPGISATSADADEVLGRGEVAVLRIAAREDLVMAQSAARAIEGLHDGEWPVQ
jgi:acetate kinase